MKRQKNEIDVIHSSLNVIGTHFNCKFYLYGSHVYKTATSRSDLNIYLDISKYFHTIILILTFDLFVLLFSDKTYENDFLLNKECQKNARKNCLLVLSGLSSDWTDFKLITFADSPTQLLAAIHRTANIICNFSFDSSIPIHTAELINYFFELSPLCRELVIFIKTGQQQYNFSFGGYIITILVIVFMQHLKLLPSVYSLQQGCNKAIIRGCELMEGYQVKSNLFLCIVIY